MAKKVPENQLALPLDFSVPAKQLDAPLTPPSRPDDMMPMHYEIVARAWPLTAQDGRVLTDPWAIYNELAAQNARDEATDSYSRRD